MKKKILIFGYGYVAMFLSNELIKLGYQVIVTTRRKSLRTEVRDKRVKVIEFDSPHVPKLLESANIILSTVPTVEQEIDPVLKRYGSLISKNEYEWIGYLSSTGVYGDHQGEWVNESSECRPVSKEAERRLQAEEQWFSLYKEYKQPINIFRLSGIYGPGRNCLERIKNGKDYTIVKEGQFFSRIHVEDIWKTLIASIENSSAGEIFNVSDDEPAPIDVVEQYGASLLGVPKLKEIPFDEADLSPMASSFFSSNKKVCNKKMHSLLNIKLSYPNYRIGLSDGCLRYIN